MRADPYPRAPEDERSRRREQAGRGQVRNGADRTEDAQPLPALKKHRYSCQVRPLPRNEQECQQPTVHTAGWGEADAAPEKDSGPVPRGRPAQGVLAPQTGESYMVRGHGLVHFTALCRGLSPAWTGLWAREGPSFSGRLGWPLRFAREEGVVASPPGHPLSSRLEVALVAFSCSGGPPRPLPALPVAHPVTSSPTMDSGGQVPKASPWFRRKLEWPPVPWPSGGSLMAWGLRLCLGVSMSPQ